MRLFSLLLAVPLLACARPETSTPGLDLRNLRMIELTHPFDEQTLYWPNSPSSFRYERLAHGPTAAGYFYSAGAFSAPEHGGTHLDAPVHFAEDGQTSDEIPLERLIAPAVVIDISGEASGDPNYRLTREDVLEFERAHGSIAPGTIVLLRTGWSSRWPDRRAYFGDDAPGDASGLRFPSYGEEAARLLVEERDIAALGADVASIDYGPSTDFIVHRIAAARNVPGLENLTRLNELPARGAWVIALPMMIRGGSGGPLRAVALVAP